MSRIAPLVLACILLVACEEPGADPALDPGAFSVEANPTNPFSALVTVTHDGDVTVRAEAGEDGEFWLATPPAAVVAGEPTEILLLGLEAGRTFDVRVVASAGEATWISEPALFITEPLPSGFPEPEAAWVDGPPGGEDAAVICTNGHHRHDPDLPDGRGTYFCFDRDGSPVWSLEHPDGDALLAVRATSDGGFAAVDDTDSLLALFDDRCARTAQYVPLWFEGKTRFVHTWIDMHEVIELADGPWAGALAFLTGVGDTLPDGRFLMGYGLIVFDPVAEEVLWDWMSHGELGDGVSIDPKLDYARGSPFPEEEGDWLHGNALIHGLDPDGAQFFWMSLRHQDWIIRIDVETDAVAWRLGFEGDFELVDDLDAASPQPLSPDRWMFHQHAPVIEARDGDRVRFLVFDNGNLRPDAAGAWDWDAEPYSRVAGFTLDTGTMRAAPTFSLGEADPADPAWFFSQIRGSVQLLPGGDRLLYLAGDDSSSFAAEVTYPEGDEEWRAELPDQGFSYRATYYPSLYETWR